MTVEARQIAEQGASPLMQPVLDLMRTVTHEDVVPALDTIFAEKQSVDPKTGIVIAKLRQFAPIETADGTRYAVYAARVLPASPDNPNFVNPHYHLLADEFYRFLSGTDGEMNRGRVQSGGEVAWSDPLRVQPGDEVMIERGVVHSFRNLGTEVADFVFCAKEGEEDSSHRDPFGDPISPDLLDYDPVEAPEGDRYIVRDFPNGIPPWYLDQAA
ncbi:MAG: cupin domain-containing protein [bacterium]|nr:cupin domain-containing protein [bacterium]